MGSAGRERFTRDFGIETIVTLRIFSDQKASREDTNNTELSENP